MVNESALQLLVHNNQEATVNFEKSESNGLVQVQDALDALQRAIEPPHVKIMKQRFHVSLHASYSFHFKVTDSTRASRMLAWLWPWKWVYWLP